MASGGGDIKAGAAHVTLYVKNNAFLKGLSAASARLKSFGRTTMMMGGAIAGASAAVLVPMAQAVKHFVDSGSALFDMSQRTRLSATTLAELGYAADQTGSSLNDVEKAIRFAKSKGYGTDFVKLAESVAAIEDPVKRGEKAMELFGKRTGHALLPMIENLKELRQRAKDIGIAPTDKEVALADELGDKFGDLKASVMATVFAVGSALAPDLIEILESVIQIAATVTRWVRDNKELVVMVAKIAIGFVAAGAAIAAIGAVIFGVGAVLGAIPVILGALVVAFKVAFIAIGIIIAMILSPIGLVIAALYFFPSVAQKALGAAGAAFAEIKAVALSAFGGIADALMGGNITLAAQILWTALKILWAEGTTWLLNKWTDWKTGIAAAFLELVSGIKLIWVELQSFLLSALYSTLSGVVSGIKAALGADLFSQLDQALGGTLSGAEMGLGVAQAASKAGMQGKRESIAKELEGQLAALNDASELDKADRQKQIDLLKKQLDTLNQQAKDGRAALAVQEDMYVPGGGEGPVVAAGAGGSTFGTFSSSAAANLGTGGGPVAEERRDRKAMLQEQRLARIASERLERVLKQAAAMGFI